ncbi:MAG: hypothetical protein LBS74_03145 [Oscillospiraceae bacterium]|jgi:hypothetical protein|nr:hypothetical protein [Oscillospiraceae bacterium]
MKNDLIERYIYAVTRHLPLKMRSDVAKELDSLIADMLAERCGDIQPAEKDIRVVLTKLGTPEELAAKYSGDENRAFISGTYFLVYKRILKIVLPIASAGIAFASILTLGLEWDATLNPYALFGKAVGQIFGGIVGGVIQAFAIITVIFALLERKKVVFNDGDALSNLPPVPKAKAQIKPSEPIAGMIWCVIAAVFFLGFPQLAGAWTESTGWVPIFVPSVIRSFWFFIVLWAVLGITRESVKLIEGQYTKRLAVVAIFCDVLTAISAAVVFLNGKIMNPEFVSNITELLVGEGGDAISVLFVNFNLFLLGIVFFALILDLTTTTVKAWKYSKN